MIDAIIYTSSFVFRNLSIVTPLLNDPSYRSKCCRTMVTHHAGTWYRCNECKRMTQLMGEIYYEKK